MRGFKDFTKASKPAETWKVCQALKLKLMPATSELDVSLSLLIPQLSINPKAN